MSDDGESSSSNKLYGLTNIKANIPVTLDLDESNYTQWKALVEMQCVLNDIEGHLDGTAISKGKDDKQWIKYDTIIKMWIFNTISKPLLQMVMKKDMTAHQLWISLRNLFECNKDARAMQLNEDLRNTTIGDQTITDYCHKMKVIFDLLENIGQPIDERTLVMHTINGLSEKYENLATIIRHQKPLPTFVDVRAMLQLEETRLKRHVAPPAIKDSSSSPTVLYSRGNNNNNRNSGSNGGFISNGGTTNYPCRNFLRGHCQFGERCRFSHATTDPHRKNSSGNTGMQRYNNQPQVGYNNSTQAIRPSSVNGPTGFPTSPAYFYSFAPTPFAGGTAQYATFGPAQLPNILVSAPNANAGQHQGAPPAVSHGGRPTPSAPPPGFISQPPHGAAFTIDQATSLPQAFQTATLNEPMDNNWYMDTGATSHLATDSGQTHPPTSSAM